VDTQGKRARQGNIGVFVTLPAGNQGGRVADGNGKTHWTEYFRVATPFLLLVMTFIGTTFNERLTTISNGIAELDTKVFKHLTNDELHPPKSIVVTKAEFSIYQEMRNEQMRSIKDVVKDQFEQLRIELRNPQVYKK
jgi:hypothetical protein